MKHKLKAVAATILLSCTAASQAVGPQPAPLSQKQTLTLGFLKVGQLASLDLIDEPVKACNVDLKRVEFVRYADARTALLSGSLDVATIAPGDLAIALSQGSDKIVGLEGIAASPKRLVVRNDVTINTWKDLAGKRIGVAPGSATWFQWVASLSENNVPFNSFTSVNIQGGGTAFVQALERRDIDAVVLWEPFESQLVAEGKARFSSQLDYSKSLAAGAELGIIAATRSALQDPGKREAVRCFLWAYKSAEERLKADPQAFAQAYSRYTGLPLKVANDSVKLIDLGGVIDADQLRRQAKAFHELGITAKDFSGEIDKVWNTSLVKSIE